MGSSEQDRDIGSSLFEPNRQPVAAHETRGGGREADGVGMGGEHGLHGLVLGERVREEVEEGGGEARPLGHGRQHEQAVGRHDVGEADDVLRARDPVLSVRVDEGDSFGLDHHQVSLRAAAPKQGRAAECGWKKYSPLVPGLSEGLLACSLEGVEGVVDAGGTIPEVLKRECEPCAGGEEVVALHLGKERPALLLLEPQEHNLLGLPPRR